MIELPADDSIPQRALLHSRADIVPGVLALLRRARREVHCLHHNLGAFELSHSANVEALHTLVHASRYARVRLLVDDTSWLDNHAARLRHLQRQLSHAIEMRCAIPDDPVGDDAALIIDHSHVLVLSRSQHDSGEIWLNSGHRVQTMLAGFDRRWDAAAHNLPVDPLGL